MTLLSDPTLAPSFVQTLVQDKFEFQTSDINNANRMITFTLEVRDFLGSALQSSIAVTLNIECAVPSISVSSVTSYYYVLGASPPMDFGPP